MGSMNRWIHIGRRKQCLDGLTDDNLIELKRYCKENSHCMAVTVIEDEMKERKEKQQMSISNPTVYYKGKHIPVKNCSMATLKSMLHYFNDLDTEEEYELVQKEIELKKQNEQPESKTMNNYYHLTLLDDSIKTVGASFDDSDKLYTYMTTLDLKIGDQVVVPTTNEIKMGTVTRIDELPAIGENDKIQYKWIISKLDLEEYQKRLKKDERIFKSLKERTRHVHREQARKLLMESIPGIENIINDDVIDVEDF